MKLRNPVLPSVRDLRPTPQNADWADDLLEPRDAFASQVATLLQGNVGFDNENVDLRTFVVRDEVPFKVSSTKIKGRIVGALLLAADVSDHAQLSFTPIDTSTVELEVIFHVLQPDFVRVAILLLGN